MSEAVDHLTAVTQLPHCLLLHVCIHAANVSCDALWACSWVTFVMSCWYLCLPNMCEFWVLNMDLKKLLFLFFCLFFSRFNAQLELLLHVAPSPSICFLPHGRFLVIVLHKRKICDLKYFFPWFILAEVAGPCLFASCCFPICLYYRALFPGY